MSESYYILESELDWKSFASLKAAKSLMEQAVCPLKLLTLRFQIEGYTRLLIFRKFCILLTVILAYPIINFQGNFPHPCTDRNFVAISSQQVLHFDIEVKY